MALLHADGFSIYGTGSTSQTNFLRGVYASLGPTTATAQAQALTTPLRGIGTHCCRQQANSGTNPEGLRFVLPGGSVERLITGAAFRAESLPSANNVFRLFQFRDTANGSQITLWCTSTGVLQARLGGLVGGALIAESAVPVMTAGNYQFVEMYVRIHDTLGEVEVRREGQVVLTATGVDTQSTAIAGAANVLLARPANAAPSSFEYFAMDWYIADTTGSVNNDFLGDTQWIARRPNADTAVADWTRNGGANDFGRINDAAPDGDTTFIEANAVNNVSEFELEDTPSGVSEIVALVIRTDARKTSAGAGDLQVSALSGPDVAAGAVRNLTETYTYYTDIIQVDPATGARFQPSAFNAAKLRLERTA